uniref:RRM domain-containing protein n=1 Tax=Wuchereria bancrofti TaxID=6293 RepID=A0AAF5Q162_WUCBA
MAPRKRSTSKTSSSSSSTERSRSRSRTRSKTRSRSKTYSPERGEEGRLHVANIDESVRARDLEEAFSRFGKLSEVWVASYPPLFAFVVFKNKSDANEALAALNNTYIRNCRVRVSVALPRVRAHDRYRFGGGYGGGYYGGGGYGRELVIFFVLQIVVYGGYGSSRYGDYGRYGGYGRERDRRRSPPRRERERRRRSRTRSRSRSRSSSSHSR